MKTPIKNILLVTAALFLTGGSVYAMSPQNVTTPVNTTSSVAPQLKETPDIAHAKLVADRQPEKEATPPPAPVEPPKVVTWQDNPNHCNQDTQYIAAEAPFQCIDKPKPVEPTVAHVEAPVGGSGSCQAEIAKYDWNQAVALNVALHESAYNPGKVNNTPATGDYSVGCFQINLYGANAATRPSEAWLKVAANNVAYAYKIYTANGHSFLGQWGVCRLIYCY